MLFSTFLVLVLPSFYAVCRSFFCASGMLFWLLPFIFNKNSVNLWFGMELTQLSWFLDSGHVQALAIKKALEAKGLSSSVYVGMRYWYPFTEDAVQQVSPHMSPFYMILIIHPFFFFWLLNDVLVINHELDYLFWALFYHLSLESKTNSSSWV